MLSSLFRLSARLIGQESSSLSCLGSLRRAFSTSAPSLHRKVEDSQAAVAGRFRRAHYRPEEVERLREAVEKEGNGERKGKWHRIARMVRTRDANSCRRKWENMTSDSILGEWGEAETKELVRLHRKYGDEPREKWIKIASELNSRRSAAQCRGKWYSINNESKFYKGYWTADEDDLLRERVKQFGESNWTMIARGIPYRSPRQARQRWTEGLGGGKRKKGRTSKVNFGRWSTEEDELLRTLFERYGQQWTRIAGHMPTRTMRQLHARWTRVLNPEISYLKWGKDEDDKLKKLVSEHGSKWKTISEELPGRTPYCCRDRWLYVLDPQWRRGLWTNEEDKKLLAIVSRAHEPGFSWAAVSDYLGTRSRKQCSERYRYLLRKGKVKQIHRPPGAATRNAPKVYSETPC